TDVEVSDLDAALHRCGWCEVELEDGAGRVIAFELPDRTRLAHRAGLAVAVPLQDKRTLIRPVSPHESDLARRRQDGGVPTRAGQDVGFRTCSRRCGRTLQKYVPKALTKAFSPVDQDA